MRKVLPVILACCIGIGVSDAAVRDASTISRQSTIPTVSSTRTTTQQTNVVSRASTNRPTRTRTASQNALARTASARGVSSITPRITSIRYETSGRSPNNTQTKSRSTVSKTPRAATTIDATQSKTFGTGYNTCRDAYFTCMDQFCATADDTYRRCVCSSRLYEIKSKQRALNQSADQLQDFKDLNIAAIPKTAAEVNAMQHASEGEMVSSVIKDKSSSIAQLAGISAVLSKTKSKSLSTAGQLDIAGDINEIWATTDLTSGLNISNLTGETLYSAVHSQCVNLVSDYCSSKSLLNMVVSAYSMYIENDCSLIANTLDKKKLSADASIRETEREMNTARLENYDAHNSSSINECVAMVRRDVTADAACGSGYVHCLDATGLYLNKTTGEPIYTSNFYQLGDTVSLSDDILKNQTNRILVSELNRKRIFATNSLDTCRDMADEVWDEFMRQAIMEIYQGQQSKIRQVKNECLDVVNQCYDAQTNSLKDFSNTKEQLLLGSQLELSETLCREKLDACSNLYGGGPNGMAELLTTMTDIVTQQIAQNCFATLQEYAQQLCAVPANDTLHSYPYACRAYAPGEQRYASSWSCNSDTSVSSTGITATSFDSYEPPSSTVDVFSDSSYYNFINNLDSPYGYCPARKKYTSCKTGYYMVNADGNKVIYKETGYAGADQGNRCVKCPAAGCPVYVASEQGSSDPASDNQPSSKPEKTCGEDYAGSLYQKVVRYAIQACMRPTEIEEHNINYKTSTVPTILLQDVNATMDLIKASMSSSLKSECERLGGYWVATQWNNNYTENMGIKLLSRFYNETGANPKWGYCANTKTIDAFYSDGDSLKMECERLGGQWYDGQPAEDSEYELFDPFYTELGTNTKWGYCVEPDDD